MSNQDDISKAFEQINPDDLTALVATHFFESRPGPETFNQFIERQLYALRYGFAASEGTINPIVALSDGNVERLYCVLGAEDVGSMLNRVAMIARSTGANRFFFSRRTKTRELIGGKDTSVVWYAEDSMVKLQRQGALPVTTHQGEAVLGENTEAMVLLGEFGALMHAVLPSTVF